MAVHQLLLHGGDALRVGSHIGPSRVHSLVLGQHVAVPQRHEGGKRAVGVAAAIGCGDRPVVKIEIGEIAFTVLFSFLHFRFEQLFVGRALRLRFLLQLLLVLVRSHALCRCIQEKRGALRIAFKRLGAEARLPLRIHPAVREHCLRLRTDALREQGGDVHGRAAGVERRIAVAAHRMHALSRLRGVVDLGDGIQRKVCEMALGEIDVVGLLVVFGARCREHRGLGCGDAGERPARLPRGLALHGRHQAVAAQVILAWQSRLRLQLARLSIHAIVDRPLGNAVHGHRTNSEPVLRDAGARDPRSYRERERQRDRGDDRNRLFVLPTFPHEHLLPPLT